MFILVCFSQRRDNMLRCVIAFGITGHFGLLNTFNIFFFLSHTFLDFLQKQVQHVYDVRFLFLCAINTKNLFKRQ